MTTKSYRKKPVVIQALQYSDETTVEELKIFIGDADWSTDVEGKVYIHTLEGTMEASINDFIIKGIQGEFYPCKPDIFEATYEIVQ